MSNKVKRPMNAYMLFSKDKRAEIIQQNPELKFKVAEVAKLIGNHWKDKFNNPIQLDKSSTLFTKIQEMEIKENLGYEINLNQKIKLETKIQKLEKENQQLKNKIELFKNSKSKTRNHG